MNAGGGGGGQNIEPDATTAFDRSSTSNVSVPNRPAVLMLNVWPAVNWNVFCAICVPFRLMRHVNGSVMSPPISVIVIVPIALASQLASTVNAGGEQNMEPDATTVFVRSSTSNVSVPKRPAVLMLNVWPAVSLNVFCAICVPFRLMRHVNASFMSPPISVIVITPTACALQLASTVNAGGGGGGQYIEPDATTVLVRSSTSNVSVPNRPAVLMLNVWPAVSLNVFCAICVPFRLMRHVNASFMSPPISVIVIVPFALASQLASTVNAGGGGGGQNIEPDATTVLVRSSTSNVSVPNRPAVLMLNVWPAVNWNVFCAICVPFRLMRHVNGSVMSPPISVIVIVPIALASQLASTVKDGTVASAAAAGAAPLVGTGGIVGPTLVVIEPPPA